MLCVSCALPYMPDNQIFPWSKWFNVSPIFAYFAHIFHSCKINAPCGCVTLVLWHRLDVAKTCEQLIWKWWFVFSRNAYLHVLEFTIYLFWSITVSNFFQSIYFCNPCYLLGLILFSVAWLTFVFCIAAWFLNCIFATLVLAWHMLINLQGKLLK